MAKLTPTQQKLLDSLSCLKESTIDDLEKAVNEKWGASPFHWTLGRTGLTAEDCKWFWYCGTDPGSSKRWLHHGNALTISEALQAMLDAEKPDEV